MTLRWGIGVGLVVLTALAGCDVSVGNCDRNDAGSCFDDFPEWDAGPGIDSGNVVPTNDGAVVSEAGTTVDAAVVDGGGLDSSVADAAVPTTLTIEQFCEAQYRTAKLWRDKLEECCVANIPEREVLLFNSLFYSTDGTGKDSVERCIDGVKATPTANLTFTGTAAPACSARYNSQFPAPPAACPTEGFAIETLESTIGHGAGSLIQFAECRAAFVGKVAFNAACTNSFECQSGLRCLGTAGAKTCRAPLSRGNPCSVTSECEDGHVCMGLASGNAGRVCYPATELLETGSACDSSVTSATGGSTECRGGLICFDNKCTAPQATAICKP